MSSVELGVELHGPHAAMDARAVTKSLQHVLQLLTLLDHEEAGRSPDSKKGTRWAFSQLGLGSVQAAIESLEHGAGSSIGTVNEAFQQIVRGFEEAESEAVLPRGWSTRAAKHAADAARIEGGLRLIQRDGPHEVASVEVTPRARKHLLIALEHSFTSLGSRRGHLGWIADRLNLTAGLWTEVANERIALTYPPQLADAFGKA
ncbi:hypothetical protein H9Y04_44180 [Streptomyces sp. TRM66268-LWL]|uniref:Uncharacterized protein n=1 Tax=Streptomyces polyasparticus TaxID=2767826 RepID=A0ABR7SVJ7_9ACTN|nr:hypothetical protein [Streptomyces polyasparticus]MBC9719520.1 hypothetical protein [Streptomyces polyasparticus]